MTSRVLLPSKGQSTTQKKAAKLLNILPESGPKAFSAFINALKVTGQLDIMAELLKQEDDARVEKDAAQVLFPIYIYNSVLTCRQNIINSSASAPLNATKIAVKKVSDVEMSACSGRNYNF